MEKKNIIIIILIVVAVAAFLIWKRRMGRGGISETPDYSGSGLDPNSLEDCMTAAFGNDQYANIFRSRVLYAQQTANNNPTYRSNIEAQAAHNGFTYQQQLTYQGAYEECARHDDYAHKAYLQTVKERLAAM